MSTLISVVIPCYNHGRFLREAIDSVGRPAHETEIVVVDDGSTDDTADIAASHRGPNPVRLIRQEHAGLAAARNRGFRESRGDYIVFLDADDRLARGAINIGAAALEGHRESFFAFGRCLMMAADGTLLPTPSQPRIVKDHYRELLRRNYVWMPAMVIFRREALNLVGGFNSSVDASADYELYLRIARHHPVHDHAQVVAHYRRHEGNTRRDASRMLVETLAVLRSQRPFLERDDSSLAAYREGWHTTQEFYGTQLVNEIRVHAHAGEWLAACVKATTLARYHPRGFAHHLAQKIRLGLPVHSRRSCDPSA